MPALVDEHGNTHPSDRDRRGDYIDGEQQWEPVPCGQWFEGGNVHCAHHTALFEAQYPQGWASYPGDVCPHHMYTGGMGIDRICQACEDGNDEDPIQEATFMLRHVIEVSRRDLQRILDQDKNEAFDDMYTEYETARINWDRVVAHRAYAFYNASEWPLHLEGDEEE